MNPHQCRKIAKYGLTGDVDDERDSGAERLVITTPVVTRMICVRVYLASEISVMIQPKIGLKLFEGLTLQQN